MEGLINRCVELSQSDASKLEGMSLIHSEDKTQIYRIADKTTGRDGVWCVALVDGVSAKEMVEVFHSQELKLQWDLSIERSDLLEDVNDTTALYHQIQKRIWPAAQRDFVYTSHKGQVGSDWVVCNVSTETDKVPADKFCRAKIEVVFYCRTVMESGAAATTDDRSKIKCQIFYLAKIDPGGWIPAAAVQAVAAKEYSKFLKNIASFGQKHFIDKEVAME
eukprot:sb/3479611/